MCEVGHLTTAVMMLLVRMGLWARQIHLVPVPPNAVSRYTTMGGYGSQISALGIQRLFLPQVLPTRPKSHSACTRTVFSRTISYATATGPRGLLNISYPTRLGETTSFKSTEIRSPIRSMQVAVNLRMLPGEILSSLGNATFWWCGLGQRPNQVKNEKYVEKNQKLA